MSIAITTSIQEHEQVVKDLLPLIPTIEKVAATVIDALKKGGKIIFLGNGGSATDAEHLATEYVSKFAKVRKGLPALSLSSSMATITSIANDWDYTYTFARQLESLAGPDDVIIALSTSGTSKNVVAALEYCKKNNLQAISFTGNRPNPSTELAQIAVTIPSATTARIQEAYMLIHHIICQIVDEAFPA